MAKKFIEVEIVATDDGAMVADYRVRARDAVIPREGETVLVPVKGGTVTMKVEHVEHYLHVEPEKGNWGNLAQHQVKLHCSRG